MLRLSDNLFWNGEEWGKNENWTAADGLKVWEVSFPRLVYAREQTYGLLLRGTDTRGNAAVSRHYLRPPAPTGLVVTQEGRSIAFSWNEVPGCNYLLEVSDVPHYDTPLVYQFVGEPTLVLPDGLPEGTYYWRVYARIIQTGA